MRRQVSIKEIAEMAKVNPSTVSRVLSGDTRYSISEEVRNRIQALAETHSYAPLGSARALAQKKSFNIALILDRIERDMGSSSGALFLGALCREITRRGYAAFLLPASGKDVDTEVLRCIRASNADAYFIGGLMAGTKTLSELARCKTPTVTYWGDTLASEQLPNVSIFAFDTDPGYRELFREAATRGFRRAAIFFSREHRAMTQRFQSALLAPEYGIEISEIRTFDSPSVDLLMRHNAMVAAEENMDFLRQQQLVLCSSDLMALGVCDALRRNGIQPGRDLSVIGFDNLEPQAVYNPPETAVEPFLATIDPALPELGCAIADFLLDRISDKNFTEEKIFMKTTFISRASMGFPKK